MSQNLQVPPAQGNMLSQINPNYTLQNLLFSQLAAVP